METSKLVAEESRPKFDAKKFRKKMSIAIDIDKFGCKSTGDKLSKAFSSDKQYGQTKA